MRPLYAAAVAVALVPPPVVVVEPEPLPDVAYAIRECESGGNYTAENPVSSASGAWQFVSATWAWVTGLEPPASAYPAEVQDAAFLELWDEGRGASHWEASRACWGGN